MTIDDEAPVLAHEITIFEGENVAFFSTQMSNSLVALSKRDFQSCDLTSGRKVAEMWDVARGEGYAVKFDTPGTFYYTSDATGACTNGMKLKVVVLSLSEGQHC